MAKIKFGAIVSDVRGSIDSVTYARSRYGAYARKKVTPVNPNTAKQSAIRALFGAASSLFRSLGVATINAWNEVAPQYTRSNIFGDNLPLSGQTLFTKLKTQLTALGVASDPTPMSPQTVPSPDAFEVLVDQSATTMQFKDTTPTTDSQVFAIYASAPVSAGKSFFSRSELRLIRVIDPSSAAVEMAVYSDYSAVFGAVLTDPAIIGQKIRFQAKLVNVPNGQAGVESHFDAIIAA
jgi:hypothetical protein